MEEKRWSRKNYLSSLVSSYKFRRLFMICSPIHSRAFKRYCTCWCSFGIGPCFVLLSNPRNVAITPSSQTVTCWGLQRNFDWYLKPCTHICSRFMSSRKHWFCHLEVAKIWFLQKMFWPGERMARGSNIFFSLMKFCQRLPKCCSHCFGVLYVGKYCLQLRSWHILKILELSSIWLLRPGPDEGRAFRSKATR
jgi:hypothetical protein